MAQLWWVSAFAAASAAVRNPQDRSVVWEPECFAG